MEVMDKDLAHIQITVTCFDYKQTKSYELASNPEQRLLAILTLQQHGFDVAIRLSPLLEEYMDFDLLNSLSIDKCIVEFLRYNSIIRKWFPQMDYTKYTLWDRNYYHLPLKEKIRILEKVKLPNISICEKVDKHYDYWMKHFNPNKADCCNLRVNPLPTNQPSIKV
jgi:DNA repair photolyase